MHPHLLASFLRRTDNPSSLHPPEGLPETKFRASLLGIDQIMGCDGQNGHGFCGLPHPKIRAEPLSAARRFLYGRVEQGFHYQPH